MNVTVDANILFACLIKEGNTRKAWFNPELILFAPQFIIIEFTKYKEQLEKKYDSDKENFDQFFQRLLNNVKLISDSELYPYIPAASTLSTDQKDWFYLACALKENTIIWSNDKEMKKQNRITIKTTEELIKEIGLL